MFGRGGAAELLDVKPTTLASRIKALGITIEKPRERNGRGASGELEFETGLSERHRRLLTSPRLRGEVDCGAIRVRGSR